MVRVRPEGACDVTKLIIYRGETLHSEVTLGDQTLKIGRSPQNDIVLEDPGKGVSRTHAEIRPEGNGYRLVDLESQNGIWVLGKRVPSVMLEPGVAAALGPFRVTVDPGSPATQVYAPITDAIPDTGTEFSRPAAPLAEPVAVDGLGALLSDEPPADAARPATPPPPAAPAATVLPAIPASKPAAPAPPSRAAAAPTPKAPAAAAPPRAAKATASGGSPGSTRTLLIAVGALVLIAAVGVGAYLVVHNAAKKRAWDRQAAQALVSAGKCQEALDTKINPALQIDPNNAEALSLKQQCAPPPAPPPPPVAAPAPVAKTNTQKLDDAEVSLTANACQAALDTVNGVLTDDPNDERAKALAVKANTCLNPTPVPVPAASEAAALVKVAPAQGGLDATPNETQKDYRQRIQAMRKRYDDAVQLLQAQHYQQALREFDAIAGSVPAGYLDLAQRRADARAAIKDDSGKAYAAAQQAEQRGDWNAAIDRYQRAHDTDPTRDVTADIARITDQKARLGHEACSNANALFIVGHNAEAATQYAKVVDLLPSSDACYATAKERLAVIKR